MSVVINSAATVANINNAGSFGSISGSFTNTSGTLLTVELAYESGVSQVGSTCTYGGVTVPAFSSVDAGGIGVLVFALIHPLTGANTLTINFNTSFSGSCVMGAISFTGSDRLGVPANTTFGSGTTESLTVNSTANSIVVDTSSAQNAGSGGTGAGTGQTAQWSFGNGFNFAYTGLGSTKAGSSPTQTMTINSSTSFGTGAYLAFSVDPPASISITETPTASDSVRMEEINAIKVTDTTAVSASVTMAEVNFGLSGMLVNLVSTSYKWVTSTLLAAQKQFNIHPYFTAKIIDDTVQPNAVLIPTGSGANPAGNGTLLRAPDGSLIAAGFDGSDHISFFKATDMNAAAGVWPTQVTLDTGTDILNAQNRVSMAVSEMINGSYRIDISYFNNFVNSAADIVLINQHSDDGGVTWTKSTIITPTSMSSSLYATNSFNLCLATMKPYLNTAGQLVSGWLYIKQSGSVFGVSNTNGYDLTYVTRTGSTISTETPWSPKNIDSGDWTLQGVDTYTVNGTVHVIFSGFRNIVDTPNASLAATGGNNGNFGLWHTSINTLTNSISSDLWKVPTKLLISLANTSNNLNSFTFPVVNVDASGQISCLFRATVTSSVAVTAQGATSQIVTPHTNYMIIFSQDGENFTYPTPVVDASGNELQVQQNPPGDGWVSYAQQANYYYIGGESMMWQFIQNNITADVTQDVINWSISEAAGQPSSINIAIANQNNKWVGNSPTGTGAAAIAKNRKIAVNPGYYNASSTPEVAPRNVYFIDDINQNVTSSNNSFTLIGRDLYKKLLITITKFAFGWFGPFFYSDTFDGSTLQNWNQQSGTWDETTNPGFMTAASSAIDSVITLSGLNTVIPFSSSYVINFQRPVGGTAYFYPLYIDSNNWLRLSIIDGSSSYSIDQMVAGSSTNLATGSFSIASGFVPILIKQYEYYKFAFIIGGPAFGTPNALAEWNLPIHLSNEIDLTSVFVGPNPSFRFPWTVGFGCTSVAGVFGFFKYVQYMPPNALYDLIKSLATKASVFSYKFQDLFIDYFFTPSNYTGTFTSPNRNLVITAGNQALNNVSGENISDGELKFVAKVVSGSTAYGFSVIFRNANGNQYMFNVAQTSGGIQCRFQFLFSGTTYPFPNSFYDCSVPLTNNSLSIDITQNHTYRIVMVGGWMYAFIDDIMVAAWNDNNTDTNYLTTGTWGWIASANTTLIVNHVQSSAFWKQIPTFSLNPGDDVSDAITSIIQTLRAWFFSDLRGYFKALFLNSTDPSTYTYDNQLAVQGVDQSDKEYISQVTVYGNNGIQATATNTTLMAGATIREEVIVDYTITTQADAQLRANNEITNANQYRNQYNPKQTMNVGGEMFDSVTVINTGSNSSGVNGGTRAYGQVLTVGGSNSEYSIEIQTGNL